MMAIKVTWSSLSVSFPRSSAEFYSFVLQISLSLCFSLSLFLSASLSLSFSLLLSLSLSLSFSLYSVLTLSFLFIISKHVLVYTSDDFPLFLLPKDFFPPFPSMKFFAETHRRNEKKEKSSYSMFLPLTETAMGKKINAQRNPNTDYVRAIHKWVFPFPLSLLLSLPFSLFLSERISLSLWENLSFSLRESLSFSFWDNYPKHFR